MHATIQFVSMNCQARSNALVRVSLAGYGLQYTVDGSWRPPFRRLRLGKPPAGLKQILLGVLDVHVPSFISSVRLAFERTVAPHWMVELALHSIRP